ncbi:MAG: hypothetical protein CMB48_04760, partial [Euryarchaeota archaeon]|nr:hypothetical protein [Euryarchaeota archaeon]
MILSGIQAMLPALGHEWYSQNELNLEDATPNSEYTAPADQDIFETIAFPEYTNEKGPELEIDSNNKLHLSFRDDGTNKIRYATNTTGTWT